MARAEPSILDRILDSVQSCAAPIWTNLSPDATPATVDHNGTCGFVDTGTRKILLTAFHVLERFHEIERTNPDAVLVVNLGPGCSVALTEPEVLDHDPSFDLASLSFSHLDHHRGAHDKPYFPSRIWPIPRAEIGNLTAFVGFPGQRRRAHEAFGSFEPVGAGFFVTSVSDRSIVLADGSGTMHLENSSGREAGTLRTGGFSGAPVFLVHPSGPQLLGVPIRVPHTRRHGGEPRRCRRSLQEAGVIRLPQLSPSPMSVGFRSARLTPCFAQTSLRSGAHAPGFAHARRLTSPGTGEHAELFLTVSENALRTCAQRTQVDAYQELKGCLMRRNLMNSFCDSIVSPPRPNEAVCEDFLRMANRPA